jgi:WASH complex subunit strumpellin
VRRACRYFVPDILHNKQTTMREIVDKHFNDNWIISVHMGWVVNLAEEWARYKGASNALKNTLALPNIEELVQRHTQSLATCEKELVA